MERFWFQACRNISLQLKMSKRAFDICCVLTFPNWISLSLPRPFRKKRKPHISFVLVWGKTQTRNIWGIYHEGTFFSFTFLFIRKLRLEQNTRFSNTCRGLALSWALQHRAGHKAASVTLGSCESFLGTLPPWAHNAEVNNSAPTLYVPAAALQIPYIPSFQSFPCCYLLWHPVWFILCTSSMKSNKCPISYFHLSIFIIFMSEVSQRGKFKFGWAHRHFFSLVRHEQTIWHS